MCDIDMNVKDMNYKDEFEKTHDKMERYMDTEGSDFRTVYFDNPIEDKLPSRLIYYAEKHEKMWDLKCTSGLTDNELNYFHWDKKVLMEDAPSVLKMLVIFHPEKVFDKDTIRQLELMAKRFIQLHGVMPIIKQGWVTTYCGADGEEIPPYVHTYVMRLLAIEN